VKEWLASNQLSFDALYCCNIEGSKVERDFSQIYIDFNFTLNRISEKVVFLSALNCEMSGNTRIENIIMDSH